MVKKKGNCPLPAGNSFCVEIIATKNTTSQLPSLQNDRYMQFNSTLQNDNTMRNHVVAVYIHTKKDLQRIITWQAKGPQASVSLS